ncbi:cell division protein ZapA [Clostridium tyrobutyricum]|uniref:cell division protein ZapA n=1 Tax=Clostridium tyrobutyricum TaxID=1519 RepID=UPI001C3953D3|nr:cell division protein ZapA [Clostridium tyrobutyricum]MBV4419824.1 cell division protein ZapA [Clostridium tyrobutyricum]
MNVVTVIINGIEYNLKGDEQEEYLHRISTYVDKKVKNILENNNKLSTSSAAILSAVNVADDMFKTKERNERLEQEIQKLKKFQTAYENKLKQTQEFNTKLEQKLNDYEENTHQEEYEDKIKKLQKEIEMTKNAAEDYVKENTKLKLENKENKFKIQTLKYKLIDLQNKLEENQINLAKERKRKNPLLNDKKK